MNTISKTNWSKDQENAFNSWASGNVIEYRTAGASSWVVAADSVMFSKSIEYRQKMKPAVPGSKSIPYKRRGNFRFRWRDELQSWLNGKTVRFYDDKKKEWHSLHSDSHIWDCITIYDIVE